MTSGLVVRELTEIIMTIMIGETGVVSPETGEMTETETEEMTETKTEEMT